jgi:hypothetical protein
MNQKKVESLYDQLMDAATMNVHNPRTDSEGSWDSVECCHAGEICGKPDNIVVFLGSLPSGAGFSFTEQNLNDANIDENHNLVIQDNKNTKIVVEIFSACPERFSSEW